MDNIFNRNLLKTHRDNASYNIKSHDFLINHSSNQIFDHVTAFEGSYKEILDLGSRHGLLTNKLIDRYKDSNITASDISDKMLSYNNAKNKIILDEENLSLNSKFDLITSVLNAHWINDLPGFFRSVKNHLTDDGLFIFSMFCAPSLKNLRNTILKHESESESICSPHISPFVDPPDIYKLLQHSGFKFIILDLETIEVEYENPIALMRELKAMGESNNLTRSNNIIGKRALRRIINEGLFVDNFEIASIIARVR